MVPQAGTQQTRQRRYRAGGAVRRTGTRRPSHPFATVDRNLEARYSPEPTGGYFAASPARGSRDAADRGIPVRLVEEGHRLAARRTAGLRRRHGDAVQRRFPASLVQRCIRSPILMTSCRAAPAPSPRSVEAEHFETAGRIFLPQDRERAVVGMSRPRGAGRAPAGYPPRIVEQAQRARTPVDEAVEIGLFSSDSARAKSRISRPACADISA